MIIMKHESSNYVPVLLSLFVMIDRLVFFKFFLLNWIHNLFIE
jgi:hypothetical protein